MAVGSRNRGLRSTRQGDLVRHELGSGGAFRSAQSVFADLRSRGENVGLSTVYRHLQALADGGDVDTLQTGDSEVLYRLCGESAGNHHHHLVCRVCGTTVEIEGRSVERWADQVAADNGFTDVGHTIELLGLCATCSQLAAP